MTYDPSSPPLPQLLRLKQVIQDLQISKSSLYAKLNPKSPYFDPTFVKPFYLPKSRIPLWNVAELDAWLKSAQANSTGLSQQAPSAGELPPVVERETAASAGPSGGIPMMPPQDDFPPLGAQSARRAFFVKYDI